jgi:hypothetical protein
MRNQRFLLGNLYKSELSEKTWRGEDEAFEREILTTKSTKDTKQLSVVISDQLSDRIPADHFSSFLCALGVLGGSIHAEA